MTIHGKHLLLIFSLALNFSCHPRPAVEQAPSMRPGSHSFLFQPPAAFGSKSLKVHCHFPRQPQSPLPVVMVMHGVKRNAAAYRDAWIQASEEKGCLVVAPEFSRRNFPGGDQYNLGNVFADGDHPSPDSRNPESQWSFALIEPLFDEIRRRVDQPADRYFLYGHSAGAQFVHRMLLFQAQARVEAAVVSAAGWYTLPDPQLPFPYGLQHSQLDPAEVLPPYFRRRMWVLVGSEDDDPQDAVLRRNPTVDRQGPHRKARAQYFFESSRKLAAGKGLPFHWEFQLVPQTGHSHSATSARAAQLFFP